MSTFAQTPEDESSKGKPSTNNTRIVTHEEATQYSDDQNLLEIYNQMHAKPEKVRKVKEPKIPKIVTPEMMYKKGKRLKTAGYVVGGTLIAAGITSLIIGATQDEYGYENLYAGGNAIHHYKYYNHHKSSFYNTGFAAIGGGVIIGTPMILRGSTLQKKSYDQIHTASVYNQGINFNNGSSLNLGIDVISSNLTYIKTPGIGLRYNF